LASDAVIVIELVYALIWEKERSHWICGLLQGDDAQRWPILYHDQKASSSEPSLHELGLGVEDFTRVVTGAIDVMSDRNAPGA